MLSRSSICGEVWLLLQGRAESERRRRKKWWDCISISKVAPTPRFDSPPASKQPQHPLHSTFARSPAHVNDKSQHAANQHGQEGAPMPAPRPPVLLDASTGRDIAASQTHTIASFSTVETQCVGYVEARSAGRADGATYGPQPGLQSHR